MVCIHFPIGMTPCALADLYTWTFKRAAEVKKKKKENREERRGGYITYGDLCKIAAREVPERGRIYPAAEP